MGTGVRASIDSDVDSMVTLLCPPGVLPRGMDLPPLMAEAKRQLHAGADYGAEAGHHRRFGELLAGSETFALLELAEDLSTPQVLAMTYLDSAPLDSLVQAAQAVRDRAAAALIDLVLRELFDFGLMQTDPNLANNRHYPRTDRIVRLNFGAVQPIAPALAADFGALARVALEGGAEATLRIGYFGEAIAPHPCAQPPKRPCRGRP